MDRPANDADDVRAKTAPYDALRRTRRRSAIQCELRHKDQKGLRGLLDEYFSMADELEPGPPRAA